MRLDEATDLRADGVRVKELRLGGEVIFRNYPYLRDDFNGAGIDTNVWDIIDPDATGDYSVSGGVLNIYNDDTVNDGTSNVPLVGIISKKTFPVGATVEARVNNPQGRHAGMIGFFATTPTSVGAHGGSVPGFNWYARRDINSTVISHRDENDVGGYTQRTENFGSYHVLKIERVDASTIKFYKDNVLVHTLTGVTFANDYRVCFICDSWTDITEINVDWVEAIGPFDPTVS